MQVKIGDIVELLIDLGPSTETRSARAGAKAIITRVNASYSFLRWLRDTPANEQQDGGYCIDSRFRIHLAPLTASGGLADPAVEAEVVITKPTPAKKLGVKAFIEKERQLAQWHKNRKNSLDYDYKLHRAINLILSDAGNRIPNLQVVNHSLGLPK